MQIENGKIEGDVELKGKLQLNGMITGSATVLDGAVMHLHGMVLKDLTVEQGADVVVRGMVNGTVTNNGGKLSVHGTVGAVSELSGETYIAPNAIVKNRVAV